MTRFPAIATLAAALSAAVPAAAQGTIEGRVPLPKARVAPVMNRRYEIVSSGGVLAPNPPLAVVYLEGAPAPAPPDPPPVARVVQTNFAFVPALLPVRVGTRVEFPNQDDTFHNVFSYSPAKRFDLGRYRRDEKPVPAQVLDKPGLVTLRCDIHEHMRGLILVLDTPYFAVSDESGRFVLTNVPPGRFTLKAWVDSRRTLEVPVTVGTNGPARVEFP